MNAISQPPETTDVSGETMRQFFKQLNRFMLLMWRLGLSGYVGGNRWSGYIMVITHTGRKSGRRRRTPVNYALVDGDLYCLAAYGRRADWYRNLLTQPAVEVWLPTGRWAGLAAHRSLGGPGPGCQPAPPAHRPGSPGAHPERLRRLRCRPEPQADV